MTAEMRVALKGIFSMDPSITSDQIKTCFMVLSGSQKPCCEVEILPLVVSRAEAARMMGISPRAVDVYARSGELKRVYYRGERRSSGFLRSSVEDKVANSVH